MLGSNRSPFFQHPNIKTNDFLPTRGLAQSFPRDDNHLIAQIPLNTNVMTDKISTNKTSTSESFSNETLARIKMTKSEKQPLVPIAKTMK